MMLRARAFATLAVSAALFAACGDAGNEGRAEFGHVHGLGVNPADGTLYAATHHGLFRVTENVQPEQIAGRTQDFMGFTIVGPDHFLASGHPGPDDTAQPPQLGLIESIDGGETWTSVSLSGEADFHAMEAKHNRVYGYNSQSGQLMTSTDRNSWDRGAVLGIADIAVAPDQPDEIIAATRQGPARSTDGGRAFTALANAPILSLVDWPDTGRLIGTAPDGTVYESPDRGASWARRGQAPGNPTAIVAVDDEDIYIATEEAILRSNDGAATFTVFQQF